MTNPFNVEKTIQKYQQLAKDAQSLGDPVLVENYMQHVDHFSRKLNELNLKNKSKEDLNSSEKIAKENNEEAVENSKIASGTDLSQEKKD